MDWVEMTDPSRHEQWHVLGMPLWGDTLPKWRDPQLKFKFVESASFVSPGNRGQEIGCQCAKIDRIQSIMNGVGLLGLEC